MRKGLMAAAMLAWFSVAGSGAVPEPAPLEREIRAWIRQMCSRHGIAREAVDRLVAAGEAAVPALREAVMSPDEDVASCALDALSRITDLEHMPLADSERLSAAGSGAAPDPAPSGAVILALIRQLGSPQSEARCEAGNRLVAAGMAALPALREALKDEDEEIASGAKDVMSRIRRIELVRMHRIGRAELEREMRAARGERERELKIGRESTEAALRAGRALYELGEPAASGAAGRLEVIRESKKGPYIERFKHLSLRKGLRLANYQRMSSMRGGTVRISSGPAILCASDTTEDGGAYYPITPKNAGLFFGPVTTPEAAIELARYFLADQRRVLGPGEWREVLALYEGFRKDATIGPGVRIDDKGLDEKSIGPAAEREADGFRVALTVMVWGKVTVYDAFVSGKGILTVRSERMVLDLGAPNENIPDRYVDAINRVTKVLTERPPGSAE